MKEIIISELHRVFSSAILRFAKEKKHNSELFHISLFLNEDREVSYNLCYEGIAINPLTILNILNVRVMDLKGYSVIVPPHIKTLLESFENQYDEFVEINVHLDRDEEKEGMIRLFLYKTAEFVKEIQLDELIKM
jgi:hypothetical protein